MTGASEVVFNPTEVRTHEGRTLLVRECNWDDFAALVEMYKSFQPKRVAQGLPPPDVPRIAHWLDQLQQESRGLLAFQGQGIVAHAVLCPISDATVEFTIFVLQDFRGQGLGTALTRLALNFACEMGFAEVFLSTEVANSAALGLYRKLGFHVQNTSFGECEMRLSIRRAADERPRAA